MNAIDIKIGNELLDVGDISVRFDLVNEIFITQSTPGFYSMPAKVQNNEHNRKVLNLPHLVENADALPTGINATLLLFGNPWVDCVLSVTEATGLGEIELNIVAGIDEGFGSFTKKQLRNLDFGTYNDFTIPETWRYSIGYFWFNPAADTIRISIGQPGTPGEFFTYDVTPTGNGLAMVNNIISQINADTASHKGVAKLLFQKDILGSPAYVCLIKGTTQFDFKPQTIGGSSSAYFLNWTSNIDNVNDSSSSVSQSNMANHMYGVEIIPTEYFAAFGDMPWRFPMIYNPNFYGTPEDAPSTFDYFINTFNSTQEKFLLRPDTLAQENRVYPDLPAIPQPKLSWVLSVIFANAGLTFDRQFFIDNPKLDNLLLFSLYYHSIIRQAEGLKGPQRFDFRKVMPGDSVSKLLDGLKKLGMYFNYDFNSKKVELRWITDAKSKNKKVKDFTRKLVGSLTNRSANPTTDITSYAYSWPSDDVYDERLPDVTDKNIKAAVATTAALPTSGNDIGDIRLVTALDQFYIVDVTTTPNTWSYFCDNFLAVDKGQDINTSLDVVPMLMIKQPAQKTGGLPSSPVLTTKNILCPVSKSPGTSPFHQLSGQNWGIRLMLHEGYENTVPVKYPFARTGKVNYNGIDPTFDVNFQLDDTNGFINKFAKPANRMTTDGLPVEGVINFSHLDILNLTKETHIKIESQEFLWQKISITIDNSIKAIRPSKVLMVKQ